MKPMAVVPRLYYKLVHPAAIHSLFHSYANEHVLALNYPKKLSATALSQQQPLLLMLPIRLFDLSNRRYW